MYVGKTTALLPYWVARDDGAFRRNGLNVEFQQLPDADTAYVYLNNSAVQVYLTPLDTTSSRGSRTVPIWQYSAGGRTWRS